LQSGQYYSYAREDPRNALITKYASPKTVDAHFQDAAGSISLLFLPVKAANIPSMDIYN
jgi:hypothetical protein